MYLNDVTLVGRLTKKPELKKTQSGVDITSFTLAINKYTKDGEKVNFINCVAFNKTAENIAQFMDKGNELLVKGSIETSSWDKEDGTKGYKTEVAVYTAQFGQKGDTPTGDPQDAPKKKDEIDYPESDINPEDIPF